MKNVTSHWFLFALTACMYLKYWKTWTEASQRPNESFPPAGQRLVVRMTVSTSITSSVTGYQIDKLHTPRKYFCSQDLNLYVLLWQHHAVRSQSETLVIETRTKVPPGGSPYWNVINGLTWISCSAERVQQATEKTKLEDIDFSLRWSMQKDWKRWMNFFESCLEEWKKRASLLSVAGLHSSARTNVSVSHKVLMGLTFFFAWLTRAESRNMWTAF